jgi:hypothetical protein
MQSAKSGVSRVLGLPAKLISVPECNGVGMPKGLARVRPRVDTGEGRRGWHSEYGSL